MAMKVGASHSELEKACLADAVFRKTDTQRRSDTELGTERRRHAYVGDR